MGMMKLLDTEPVCQILPSIKEKLHEEEGLAFSTKFKSFKRKFHLGIFRCCNAQKKYYKSLSCQKLDVLFWNMHTEERVRENKEYVLTPE